LLALSATRSRVLQNGGRPRQPRCERVVLAAGARAGASANIERASASTQERLHLSPRACTCGSGAPRIGPLATQGANAASPTFAKSHGRAQPLARHQIRAARRSILDAPKTTLWTCLPPASLTLLGNINIFSSKTTTERIVFWLKRQLSRRSPLTKNLMPN
jgi:hypothetical protein